MPGNCFFNCGCGEGPPFCPITIHFVDCDGSPIEGAVVTATQCGGGGLPITPIVGETDSDGKYTLDYGDLAPTEILRYNCYTIAWDGITAGPFFGIDVTLYNCGHAIEHCYRHAKVTIETTAAARPNLILGSRIHWTVTGIGTGTIVLDYKSIGYCATPSPFPDTLSINVGPVDPDTLAQYLCNCTTLAVDCGDDASVDLPLFKWDDDYAIHTSLAGNQVCDQGCEAGGGGPNFRGLTPNVLQVTVSTIAGAGLGIYDGVPITVTWDGVSSWDSGCLPAPGNHCQLGPYGPTFASARLQIFYGVVGPTAGFTIIFTEFAKGDCTPTGFDAVGCFDRKVGGGPFRCISSPVDVTFVNVGCVNCGGTDFSQYQIHVTE